MAGAVVVVVVLFISVMLLGLGLVGAGATVEDSIVVVEVDGVVIDGFIVEVGGVTEVEVEWLCISTVLEEVVPEESAGAIEDGFVALLFVSGIVAEGVLVEGCSMCISLESAGMFGCVAEGSVGASRAGVEVEGAGASTFTFSVGFSGVVAGAVCSGVDICGALSAGGVTSGWVWSTSVVVVVVVVSVVGSALSPIMSSGAVFFSQPARTRVMAAKKVNKIRINNSPFE